MLVERFRRLREEWGAHVIPWKNLREIFKVLRNREMLGLLIDWGYRSDGIPVRLFGAWTTLPAGGADVPASSVPCWTRPWSRASATSTPTKRCGGPSCTVLAPPSC